MPDAMLVITGPGGQRQVELKPKGILIGRHPKCDVVLDSDQVSRDHARIFQDPFGRWIIQDLGSRNGIQIDGQRAATHPLLPGEHVEIRPFTLVLAGGQEKRIPADPSPSTTSTMLSDAPVSQVTRVKAQDAALLSRARLKSLNAIMDKLASLPGPGRLYGEACRLVARAPGLSSGWTRPFAPGAGCFCTRGTRPRWARGWTGSPGPAPWRSWPLGPTRARAGRPQSLTSVWPDWLATCCPWRSKVTRSNIRSIGTGGAGLCSWFTTAGWSRNRISPRWSIRRRWPA